jgi:hypothetical protein
VVKEIELTQEKVAVVNDEDYDKLMQMGSWYTNKCTDKLKNNRTVDRFYAARDICLGKGKKKKLFMHRVIMNVPNDKFIDHINHDTLDNRKENLRTCTNAQNQRNQVQQKNTTSKYKGVYLLKSKYKNKIYTYWMAQIKIDGKRQKYLGLFKSEIEGAKAYDKKAREVFGEFALTNF